MLFNSFHFLIFLCVVLLIYRFTAHRFKWAVLLGASYYFYLVSSLFYLPILFLSTCIDYFAGLGMHKYRSKKIYFLGLSMVTNLGLLFFFKYYDFFLESSLWWIRKTGLYFFDSALLYLVLPIGISFYTFQTLAYSIDVYKGAKPERHLGRFALYVSFFPQLVAGPIERTKTLLPQLSALKPLTASLLFSGLMLAVWGFFKKIVVADRLAIYVDHFFEFHTDFSGFQLLFVIVLFGIQIYCDFSGYTDIARGVARMFGVTLLDNFRFPYFATSLQDFWKRWHISLTTLFKDYIYFPLGGSKAGVLITVRNILFIFLISGLWHGANWTFVLWGVVHGLGLIIERYLLKPFSFLYHKTIGFTYTMVFVGLAWTFFRSPNLNVASQIFEKIFFSFGSLSLSPYLQTYGVMYFSITVFFVIALFVIERVLLTKPQVSLVTQSVLCILLICTTVLFGSFGQQEFIYFQF